MYICPTCSAENRGNANFCRQCGERRSNPHAAEEDSRDRCPCCSRRVRHADRFCMSCGEKLKSKPAPASKLCLSCKCLLPEKATFCTACGEYVADKSSRKIQIPSDLFGDDNPDLSPRYEA
ncbi:MAG: zinc ribbon domain-containing protein [Candidatus Obscuribacterales bacterium]|nr:zinc ribbon domain-containing protein [Candidatus Obscuribacterales bacterium]